MLPALTIAGRFLCSHPNSIQGKLRPMRSTNHLEFRQDLTANLCGAHFWSHNKIKPGIVHKIADVLLLNTPSRNVAGLNRLFFQHPVGPGSPELSN